MLSFLNMKCRGCESVYTLSIEELSVAVLFKCFECGQYNIYIAGHVLELDQDIMNEGSDEERTSHIAEIVEEFASEFAKNALTKVDRLVNVNVEIDLSKAGHPKKKRKKKNGLSKHEPSMQPSVKHANAPVISSEEVRDFVKIDLNLIDKKRFFDKFFGNHKN